MSKISTVSFFVKRCQNLGVVEARIKLSENEGEGNFLGLVSYDETSDQF